MRREKISRILKEAREQYFKRLESQGGAVKTIAKKEDNLLFVIDKEEVCEKAYVNILGLASQKVTSRKCGMTKYPKILVCIYNVYYIITRVLMTFLHILICHPGHTDTAISEEVSASRCFKRDHCYSFLKDAIDS